MQILISEDLIDGRQTEEVLHAVREGILIRDYVNREISLGEFKEKMGFRFMDDVMDWLSKRGISTLGIRDENLKEVSSLNREKLAQKLGIIVG